MNRDLARAVFLSDFPKDIVRAGKFSGARSAVTEHVDGIDLSILEGGLQGVVEIRAAPRFQVVDLFEGF